MPDPMPAADVARCYLGIGLSSRAQLADALALTAVVLERAAMNRGILTGIATIETRRDSQVLAALARHLGVGIVCFSAAELEAMTPRLRNPSDAVFRLTGCHGVAESAALAAIGERGRLVVEKIILGRVTMALAYDSAVA